MDESKDSPFLSTNKLNVHPPVFFISAGLILLFVVLSLVYRAGALEVFISVRNWITGHTGWFFITTVNVILLFCIYLIFSPYGKTRLGKAHEKPDFSYGSWLAMLFSAGMGIGLVFYSVAEPMFHLQSPPFAGDPAGAESVATTVMATTFFHWGLHAWGIYTLVGLSLAFFAFNQGLPLTIRSTFYPILGKRIHGFMGNTIDIVAVVATLFGVATSLGFGVQQVNAGLKFVFGIEQTVTTKVILIAIITSIATASVVLGLKAGVRKLSELNMLVAFILLLFVFLAGPTWYLTKSLFANTSTYVQDFVALSAWTRAFNSGWREGWTVFYWAWWIAWSPFVGMFIARISRGRTVREFVIGVLFVPTFLTFVWLTIFGGSGLWEQFHGNTAVLEAVNTNVPISLFTLLKAFPWPMISSFIGLFVIITFFVTSSDSGSLVIDIITAGGDLNPPVAQRIFWAVLEGVVAAVLLIVGGKESLKALQTASVSTGLPFALVLLGMTICLYKGLKQHKKLGDK